MALSFTGILDAWKFLVRNPRVEIVWVGPVSISQGYAEVGAAAQARGAAKKGKHK